MRGRVAPDDVDLAPGEDRHQDHDRRGDRHGLLLERLDPVEADDRDHRLDRHDHDPDGVLRARAGVWIRGA